MNKAPAFQFYPTDWLSSLRVTMMTSAEEGGYIRLLCYDWDKDGIPDDDQQLASMSRLGEGWFKGGSTKIRACFDPHPRKPGFLTNERLEKERVKQSIWREKSRQGGINSSKSRTKGKARVVEPPLEGWLPNGSNQKATLLSSSSSSSLAGEREPALPERNGHATIAQVLAKAQFIGMAEWKARDWFDEMEGCGWLDFQHRPIKNWESVMVRVCRKWEADGRPSKPPVSGNQAVRKRRDPTL